MSLIIHSFCISIVCVLLYCMVGSASYTFTYKLLQSCQETDFPLNVPTRTTILKICYCPITTVPAGALDQLTALKEIHFEKIPELTMFPNLTGVADTLEVLVLRHINLVYINPTWLNALHKLLKLTIEDSPIDYIPDVQGLSNLQALTLIDTNFRAIPHLVSCTNLTELILERNRYIGSISQFRSSFLTNVKKLHVSDVTDLVILPTTCPKDVSGLEIVVNELCLDICDCRNVWLKNAAERSATVHVFDVKCSLNRWVDSSTEELISVCHGGEDNQCKLQWP